MTVHLIKLSVGTRGIEDLRRWQKTLVTKNRGTAREGHTHHVTRMFPRRADELEQGGSIYWVIAGQILVRQPIARIEDTRTGDGRKCRLILETSLIPVMPTVRGPFQGWRYLEPKDAPRDLGSDDDADDLPIRAELAELGLL